MDFFPRLEIVYTPDSGKKIASEIIDVEDFIGIKSSKARGKRITTFAVESFNWLQPLKEDPALMDESDGSDMSDIHDDRQGFAEGIQTQLF